MIYIKETIIDEQYICIHVDGVLDLESLNLLKDVFEKHIKREAKIILNLKEISHICREGRNFLKGLDKENMTLIFPQFFSWEGSAKDLLR